MEETAFNEIELDNIIMDNSEDVDLSNFGTVEEEITAPHIKFSGVQFKFLIKIAKTLSVVSGRDVISKAILIHPEGDKVQFFITDFDVYFKYEVDRINVENVLTEDIVIPTDYLDKLSRAIGNKTVIFKDGDNYKLKLFGGDIVLETYTVDNNKFMFKDSVHKEQSLNSIDLLSVVKDFTPVVNNAVSPAERRILCDKDIAYASYMWGNISCRKSFSNMDLKVKDLNVLRNVLSEVEEELEILETDETVATKRKVIKGSNFEYAFLVSDSTVPQAIRDGIDNIIHAAKGKCYIDYAQLYKLVDISSILPTSTGKVEFNYNDSGVEFILKSKKGDSKFTLVGSKEGDTTPMSSNFTISSKLLYIFLKAFSTQSSIAFYLTEKGMGLSSNEYDAILYKESV